MSEKQENTTESPRADLKSATAVINRLCRTAVRQLETRAAESPQAAQIRKIGKDLTDTIAKLHDLLPANVQRVSAEQVIQIGLAMYAVAEQPEQPQIVTELLESMFPNEDRAEMFVLDSDLNRYVARFFRPERSFYDLPILGETSGGAADWLMQALNERNDLNRADFDNWRVFNESMEPEIIEKAFAPLGEVLINLGKDRN